MRTLKFLPPVLIALSTSLVAYADKSAIRDLPGGIVFPGINRSLLANPAMTAHDKAAAFQATYAPEMLDAVGQKIGASLAAGMGSYALGAGYAADTSDSTHQLYAAIGGNMGAFQLGVDIVYGIKPTSELSSVDIGLGFGGGTGLNGAVVARSVEDPDALHVDAGFGYAEAGKYSLEFFVQLPTFGELGDSGSEYTFNLVSDIHAGMLGVEFFGKYVWTQGGSGSFGFGGTLLAWVVSGKMNLSASYNYLNTATAGSTVSFALTFVF